MVHVLQFPSISGREKMKVIGSSSILRSNKLGWKVLAREATKLEQWHVKIPTWQSRAGQVSSTLIITYLLGPMSSGHESELPILVTCLSWVTDNVYALN